MKKKPNINFDDLLSRQNYLVVQANDLAKSFGGLKAFEQRVLDYCFSFVTKDSRHTDEYELSILDLIHHFGLEPSGDSYKRVGAAFKRLNENTALYFPTTRNGVPAIRMTQLFSFIDLSVDGKVFFKFGEIAAPYVFQLRENFYSFQLSELSAVKGKYALIILKLWEAARYRKKRFTTITGKFDDWQEWCLGENRKMTPGHFYSNVLVRGTDELEKQFEHLKFSIRTQKKGRKVVGYEMTVEDTKIVE